MKKIKIFLTIFIALFVNMLRVYCYTFGIDYAYTGSGGSSTDCEDKGTCGTILFEPTETDFERITASCSYEFIVTAPHQVTIDAYNKNDKSIMEKSLNIAPGDEIKAGTSIGLNIYETKKVSWEVIKADVTYKHEKRYKIFYCRYEPIDSKPTSGVVPSCKSTAWYYETKNKSCNAGYITAETPSGCKLRSGPEYTEEYSPWEPVGDTKVAGAAEKEYKKRCENEARTKAINLANSYIYHSYTLQATNSNDINETSHAVKITDDEAQKTKKCFDGSGNTRQCLFSYGKGATPKKDSLIVKFYYNKKKACINPKTSHIEYRNDICNANEITIENNTTPGKEHWHYFVPLNATSSNIPEISLSPAYSTINSDLNLGNCEYIMKNNPVVIDRNGNVVKTGVGTTYLDLIIPEAENTKFVGNYCTRREGSSVVSCNKYSSDYGLISNGSNTCKLASKIKIPVTQQFYNEVGSAGIKKIKGFNFYYRPIDINNPFPNGTGTTSLWAEWNAKTNNNPDLSMSYKEVTYVATNINSDNVRTYTKTHPYTSWNNMNINGTSQYVGSTDGSIIKRINSGSVYKLGCGPANEKATLPNGKTNPIYISGCGKS